MIQVLLLAGCLTLLSCSGPRAEEYIGQALKAQGMGMWKEAVRLEVDVESVGVAADLTDYFKKQVQRVGPLLRASARTPEGRCKQSLQRLFSNGKRLTKREAQRAGNAEAKVFNTVWNAWVQEKRLVPDTTDNH